MAGKKENLKALFTNTRTRIIILFTAILLIVAVVLGYFKLTAASRIADEASGGRIKRAPTGIHSIPGQQNQTAQYSALQQQQNLEQAEAAKKKGSSAIPTIIKTQAFGDGVDLIGPQYGEGGPGFTTLSQSNLGGPAKSLWTESLEKARCSRGAIKEVVDKGANLSDLRDACNCCQLRQYGYTLQDLDPVCACSELKAAGFTAREMKVAGYTADRLRRCGFSACETKSAGFSAEEMKDGGFSDGELKGAGFNESDIEAASGLPAGVSLDDVRKAGCDPEELAKLREKGVSAAAIQRISACPPDKLKAAGFSADELKRAGLSAAELKAAGYNPDELKRAGFNARELMNAGFSPKDLANAGYANDEIARASTALPPGVTGSQLREAGCSVDALKQEKAAGISAKAIKQNANCSEEALKAAGFSEQELATAGFVPVSANEIKNAGCSRDKLRGLRAKGVTAAKIRELTGCSVAELKAAGFDASDLSAAAFSPAELAEAGFTPADLSAAGVQTVSDDAVKQAGCDVEQLKALREKGVTAEKAHELNGCGAEQLKAAGYGAKDLLKSGFTPSELLDAGFDSGAINSTGLVPASVIAEGRKNGCTVKALKAAKSLGVSAETIRETLGCSASAMKAAGFGSQELKDAGFGAAALKNAGFSPKELKGAGFSADEMKDAGVDDSTLKALGLETKKKPVVTQTPTPEASAPEETSKTESVTKIPTIQVSQQAEKSGKGSRDTKELQRLMARQQSQVSDQRYQAKIKQVTSKMMSAAGQALQEWKTVPTQVLMVGGEKDKKGDSDGASLLRSSRQEVTSVDEDEMATAQPAPQIFIKTGDILFAVLDTAVNTDEPGPILATIVSGKLKGSKLIGSFTLPANADKMVITFNTLSMLGADKTIGISAYAIDPNTARTALSSRVNHHYLMRYGSLFASTFLAGFSSAIQSADTTITIGGTGGVSDTTVQNGINRSLLENALIGLGEVGKAWSETAQELMNRPTTVELFSGTGMGILFTQDVQVA